MHRNSRKCWRQFSKPIPATQLVFNCKGTLKLRPLNVLIDGDATTSAYNCIGTLEICPQKSPGDTIVQDILEERMTEVGEESEKQQQMKLQVCKYVRPEEKERLSSQNIDYLSKHLAPLSTLLRSDNMKSSASSIEEKEIILARKIERKERELNILKRKQKKYQLCHDKLIEREKGQRRRHCTASEEHGWIQKSSVAPCTALEKAEEAEIVISDNLKMATDNGSHTENLKDVMNTPVKYVERKLCDLRYKLESTKASIYQLSATNSSSNFVGSGMNPTDIELTTSQPTSLLFSTEIFDSEVENINRELKQIFSECNDKIQALLRPKESSTFISSSTETARNAAIELNRTNFGVSTKPKFFDDLQQFEANLCRPECCISLNGESYLTASEL